MCDGRGPPTLPKAACPPLPRLGGPGWVEEKWVSSVAMVTAAAPCQPSHLLTTNLTEELFCPACRDGGQESGTEGWSGYECVCIQAHTSGCSELVCMPQPREPKIQVRYFPLPCPLKGWALPASLGWAEAKERGVCTSVCECVHIYESANASDCQCDCFCVPLSWGCMCISVYTCDYVFTGISSVWVCMVCGHTFEIECPTFLPVCI